MKRPYESPTISRHQGGIANKFGVGVSNRFQSEIEGFPVSKLLQEYGSPLFVYSEKTLRRTYREMLDAFSLRYPKTRHAWSYKTNYLKAVCRSFHRLGSWAEVVSGMEYEMARANGVDPRFIVFNGPYKPYPVLKRALEDGAIVNLDSLDEYFETEEIAAQLGRPVRIGLRLNMSLGTHMSWDRYGLNIESGEAVAAVKRILAARKVTIEGIHAHIGTFVYDVQNYSTAVTKLAEFATALKNDFGISLKYIDIGGGFASRNRLRGTYLSTADMIPSFDTYAEAICKPLLEGLATAFHPEELPTLILESGRRMIDEAGVLISTISSTKRMNSGTRGLVIDAGVNLLFTSFWYDHDVLPTADHGYSNEDHVIFGPLCMQIDVIRPTVHLPHLEKGDSVIIKPAGAYNNTQWMQFINLRPNVVMISENGQIGLIRRAEDVAYLQERETVPEWLNG